MSYDGPERRQSALTFEAVEEAVLAALQKARETDLTEHAEHHEFIKELIAERRERRETWVELKRHLVKWGAVGVITFLLGTVAYWVRNHT